MKKILIFLEGPANPPIKGKQISTQIFSINFTNKENIFVFSDENSSIALSVGPNVPGIRKGQFVTSKKKLYGYAIKRNIEIGYDSSLRPVYIYRFGTKSLIYEVFIDGTNRFRKVCDVMGTQYPIMIFIDPTSTRIGLPDGERLFFSLDTGAVGVTSEESYQRIGTYFMKWDETDATRFPESLLSFPSKEGFSGSLRSECIGVRTDGILIMRDLRHKKGGRGRACSFLYLVNPDTKSKKEIPMVVFEGLSQFKVSHDGTKIAFIEDIYEDDSIHIWVRDLKTGKEIRYSRFLSGLLKAIIWGWLVG
jgi:hypothetical protein